MNILKIENVNRKWYGIILWWEVRRIPYNIFMYFIGLSSFKIAYVAIPIVYLALGLLLNILYTFGWIYELMFRKTMSDNLKFNFRKLYL